MSTKEDWPRPYKPSAYEEGYTRIRGFRQNEPPKEPEPLKEPEPPGPDGPH